MGFLQPSGFGVAELQTLAASHQECIPMPDMMLHFLEQVATRSAQLKEKDDEITRLRAEVESLKLSQKSELEKVDQEFSEEKNRLSLQLQKDKELLDAAEQKNRAMSEEIIRLEKSRTDWSEDLHKMLNYIHRKFLSLVELSFLFSYSNPYVVLSCRSFSRS